MAKILIIDDHDIVRRAVSAILAQDGHEVVAAEDGPVGVRKFRETAPDLVILDRDLPSSSGSDVLKRLRELSPTARVIVFTGFPDAEGDRKYRDLGVRTFLSKGMDIEVLVTAVRRELGIDAEKRPPVGPVAFRGTPKEASPAILVIDDDPQVQAVLKRFLASRGYRVETAPSGKAGIEAARARPPAIVLLDFNLPDMSGRQVLAELRKEPKPPSVIMITGNDDPDNARDLMSEGAADFISKPVDLEYLELSVWAKLFLEPGKPA